MRTLLSHRLGGVLVIFALFMSLVVKRFDLVQQRLGSQVANVGLLEHQALVIERLEVILFVLVTPDFVEVFLNLAPLLVLSTKTS